MFRETEGETQYQEKEAKIEIDKMIEIISPEDSEEFQGKSGK